MLLYICRVNNDKQLKLNIMTKDEILLASVTQYKKQLIKEDNSVYYHVLKDTEEILTELRNNLK